MLHAEVRNRFPVIGVFVALLFLHPSHLLHAQTSFGAIVGTVSDPSQAAVPNAAVIVTNTQTGVARQVKTDQSGNYSVPSLLPGTYSVKLEIQGFQPTEVTGVVLDVARTVTVNLTLQVGAVTERVEVQAAAPLLDSANATVGTVINNTSVVTLPLNGRSYTDLILLVPGSVPRGKLFAISGGHNFSVSGNNPDQNNFTLDGVQNNDLFFKAFAIQPSIDAIQEFRVQTNITSAEYGLGAGANVNVALKSGTNQVHGTAFEFLRNDKFDATEFFRNYRATAAQPAVKPAFRQNQWGFVVGGPVYIPKVYTGRDKIFWLFNYEGFKIRRASTLFATIPTKSELAGDLRGRQPIFDPLSTRTVNGQLVRDPISCNGVFNVICPSRIDPAMAAWAAIVLPVTDTPGAGNFVNTNPQQMDQYQLNMRTDYKIRDNLNFFARYSPSIAQETVPQVLASMSTQTIQRFYNAVASWTYVPTPTTVIDFKVGFNRTNVFQTASNPGIGAAEFLRKYPLQGIPIHIASHPLFPGLSLTDFSGTSSSGTISPTNDFQFVFSVSKIRGRHSLKTGFTIDNIRGLHDNLNETSVSFNRFATGDPQNFAATGSSIASFLLGYPDGGGRRLGNTAFHHRWGLYQFYVQDDLKVTSRLTLNLGLRYEYDQLPRENSDRLSEFDMEANTFVWAGRNPITGAPPNARRTIRDPDWNNFAPRMGLAYALNPKTTIRSGFGIFYAPNYLWEIQALRGQWPFALSESLSALNRADVLSPVETMFSPNTDVVPGVAPSATWSANRMDRTGYTEQWNLGVQHQLAHEFLLEVNYVGTRGRKLPTFSFENMPLPGPGVVGSPEHPRPYPQQNSTIIVGSNRSSTIYDALQIKADKRLANGLQFLASYAWGKYIDTGGGGNSTESFPPDERNWKADRAVGYADFRHILALSYFYELPFGRGRRYLSGGHTVVDYMVGGWNLTGITQYHSGSPVNVTLNFDNANNGGSNQRPNRVLGQLARAPIAGDKTQGWLNPDAFGVPARYTFGNLGRNTERGPGFGNWDISMLKNFPINEDKQSVQFRTDFFNGFNNVNLGNPNASYCQPIGSCNPNFGRIFGTQNPARQIQFALKFRF